jgi:hypothetical protein
MTIGWGDGEVVEVEWSVELSGLSVEENYE